MKRYHQLAWALLAYTLLVILWGAWVRISHSGDGCGNSWPLCEGQFIPLKTEDAGKTWVEFSHRITSGLYGIFVLGFYIWARRLFPKGHPARTAAIASLVFMIIEALFGAVLVKQGLVGSDQSIARVIIMSLHFLNSALLILTTTWMAAFSAQLHWQPRKDLLLQGVFKHLPKITLILLGALGLTGTFAALSTTLFPALSLGESITKEMADDAHVLLQLRTLHPILGVFGGSSLALLVLLSPESAKKMVPKFRENTYLFGGVLLVTICMGAVTLLTLSPPALKILHLAMAHFTVITFGLWLKFLKYDRSNSSP